MNRNILDDNHEDIEECSVAKSLIHMYAFRFLLFDMFVTLFDKECVHMVYMNVDEVIFDKCNGF